MTITKSIPSHGVESQSNVDQFFPFLLMVKQLEWHEDESFNETNVNCRHIIVRNIELGTGSTLFITDVTKPQCCTWCASWHDLHKQGHCTRKSINWWFGSTLWWYFFGISSAFYRTVPIRSSLLRVMDHGRQHYKTLRNSEQYLIQIIHCFCENVVIYMISTIYSLEGRVQANAPYYLLHSQHFLYFWLLELVCSHIIQLIRYFHSIRTWNMAFM